VVVQSTSSNDALIELLFILDALKDLDAKKIHSVIPYLGYSRQDKRFLDGEAITAKIVLNMINSKADTITTINAHFFDDTGKQIYEGIEINNLSAFPLLGDYFKDKLERPILIAPDEGALGYVEKTARILNLDYDYLEKKRISDDEVEMKVRDIKIARKDAILLDDIISTGGTMIEATNLLYTQGGARSVNIGVVHGVLVEGLEKVSKVADEVICTNSIFREKFSKVSLSALISEFLKKEK
jgi:ribose-phosphate pyrophosphokinase